MSLREQTRKERSKLIGTMLSKVSKTNTLDLLGSLAMDFFVAPENFAEAEFRVSQACNEFVTGLVSSKDIVRVGTMPGPKDQEEIRLLWERILATYILGSFPQKEQMKSLGSQEIEKAGGIFFILSYFMTVRGEGYPNQLWDSAIEAYSPHNSFLKNKFGFTIEEAVKIFKWLFKEIEVRGNRHALDFASIIKSPLDIWKQWRKGEINDDELFSRVRTVDYKSVSEKIRLHNEKTKNVFTFGIEEIENEFGKQVVGAFLKRFASRFGDINRKYLEPTQFNEIYRTPLLITDKDEIFVPIPPLLCQVPVITLHYDLIKDPEYEAQYADALGKYLERKTALLLGSIFGAFSFDANLYFTDNNGENGEIDLLYKFDNKIVVVECKSKSLTLPAKQGDFDQISQDFSKAVQLAYDQNQKAIKYIRSCAKAEFYEKNGKRVFVENDKISDIFSIVITANTFATLTTDLSVLLKKEPNDPYPWAICLRDLELVSEYLSDPYLFMHFLKRRQVLHGRVLSPDEMDYVGCYLMTGLYFEEELKKGDYLLLLGFTEQFDAAQLRKIGKLKTAQVGTSWSNLAYENLLGTIKLIGNYGNSDIILALLDVDSKTRDNLIMFIKETMDRTLKDGKPHDFTMLGENFGFSFISDVTRKNLGTRVYGNGQLEKYKHRATKWLAMGRDVRDKSYLVNEFAFLNYEWKFDPVLEEMAKRYLGKGRQFKLN